MSLQKPPASKHSLSEFCSQGSALDQRALPLLCAPGQSIKSVKAFDPKAAPPTAVALVAVERIVTVFAGLSLDVKIVGGAFGFAWA